MNCETCGGVGEVWETHPYGTDVLRECPECQERLYTQKHVSGIALDAGTEENIRSSLNHYFNDY